MTIQTLPVSVENGVIRILGDALLPKNAKAFLVIVPEVESSANQEWQLAFDTYFDLVESDDADLSIDELSDNELAEIIHDVRAQVP